MEETALLYRIPNRPKCRCRGNSFRLRPDVPALLIADRMYGDDRDLADITAALKGRVKQIDDLREVLGDGDGCADTLDVVAPFQSEGAKFDVLIHDFGVSAVAIIKAQDGPEKILVVLPRHRLSAA